MPRGNGERRSQLEDATDYCATTFILPDRSGLEGDQARLVLIILLHGAMREVDLPTEGTLTVGRAPESDIQVEHRSVSRLHARLTIAQDAWIQIEDAGSSNGTFLNNERLRTARRVSVGDVIRLGDVTAQIGRAHTPHARPAMATDPPEFDRRLLSEAERALRFERGCSVLYLLVEGDRSQLDRARAVLADGLREVDLFSERADGEIAALLIECDREDAWVLAERLHDALVRSEIPVRIGVATFPGDAPSPDHLCGAAQLAAASRAKPGVTAAGEAARIRSIGSRHVVIADVEMQRLFARIERVARTGLSVLIVGETGTGKEIAAEAIHELSTRAGALVKINVAAIPENLLESELFGHERGAFSGAQTGKPGLFEQAEGGTLFLDEIGELKLDLQAKLLRVLEDHRVRRVGGVKDTFVDVRVVSASHRDLRKEAQAGHFREDLFYRLNGVAIRLPPLRERPSEILLLAKQFAADACRKVGRQPVSIGPAAAELLQRYPWPGNIRELKQAVEQAALLCGGDELEAEDLPCDVSADAAGAPQRATSSEAPEEPRSLDEELRAFERRRISEALVLTKGNQTQAAKVLGIPRRTLVSKMAVLGLSRQPRDHS